MITLEDVERLFRECLSMVDHSVRIDVDSPVTIDSLFRVSLLHLLEERHGIEIAPSDPAFPPFVSVRAFHDYLSARSDGPARAEPAGPLPPVTPTAPVGSSSWWGEDLLRRRHHDDVWVLTDRAVTYGELREQVQRVAARLAAGGVGHGCAVAVHLPPSLGLLYATLAAWSRGAQVLLVDIRSTAVEVDRLLRVCEPQFLLSAPPGAPSTGCLVEDVPFTLVRRATGRPAVVDTCLVQASSGSTGTPKVIGRSPASLRAELGRYTELEGMPTERERVLLLNSVIHTMGLVGGVLHGLNTGAQMVFPASLRPETIMGTAWATESAAIFGVPVHFALLAGSAAGAVPSLRLAVSAGELLPHEVWARFRRRYGLPISPVYGMTETGIIAADLVTGPAPPVVGRPTAGMEVSIVSDELRVRMEHTPYLWSDRSDRFRDGWVRTYDRCQRDPVSGVLTYRGRIDSVVSIGGLKVDLTEVEQTLLLHPRVRGAVVVHDDPIEAYLEADPTLTATDIAQWCRSRLSDFKVPKVFRFHDALPRNPNGKLIRDRDVLREQEGAGAHTEHR